MSPPATERRRWVLVVAAVVALALVLIGGTLAVVTGVGRVPVPADDSVDAGFARDMSIHHRQAVTMAAFVRDQSADSEVELLAFDIESTQNNQVGMMQGWLGVWDLPVNTTAAQMSWMADGQMDMSNGLMPGMATPDELQQLRGLSGTELDVRFLQLMIRHHLGGVPMARYAVEHAATGPVRRLAQTILDTQSAEVLTMEQMLRDRGRSTLPPP